MAQQDINIGAADEKQGDTYFTAFTKTQANFTELYTDVGANTEEIAVNAVSIGSIITAMQTRASFGNTVSATGALQESLTGTGDAQLPPPATAQPETGGNYNGYVRVSGLVEISAMGELSVTNAAFVVGANGDGDYRTPHAWVGMSSSVTATTVGFIFGIVKLSDGLIHFSQRVTGARMAAQNDLTNTSGGGFVFGLEAGDKLSMWVAADKTATITIYDMNIGLEMAIAESLK